MMSWTKMTLCTAAGIFSLLASSHSYAACTFPQLKSKIETARKTLVEMLGGKTDAAQQKFVKDTADDVSHCFTEISVPKGKDKDFAELKGAWEAFKNTRETELVPAILAGKTDNARKTATGIQKERLDKMMRLIMTLQGGDL